MKKFEELSMQEMKEIYKDYINLKSTFAATKKVELGLSGNSNKHSEEQEYQTMDDSLKSFVKMEQRIKERDANLANQITHYAQEHGMSWEELMRSLFIVKQVFCSGAVLRKFE